VVGVTATLVLAALVAPTGAVIGAGLLAALPTRPVVGGLGGVAAGAWVYLCLGRGGGGGASTFAALMTATTGGTGPAARHSPPRRASRRRDRFAVDGAAEVADGAVAADVTRAADGGGGYGGGWATLPHPRAASAASLLTAEAGVVADVAWAAVGAIAMTALSAAAVLM